MLSLGKESLYPLLLDLVSIQSVSFSAGENAAAEYIFSRISEVPYFKTNPSLLRLLPLEGDPLGRNAVAALVRSFPDTRRTVIVTGHFDVVDSEAYGPLKHLAFSPEELTKKVGELDIPEEARKDLESGEYLFGRGVEDMKAGIAAAMGLVGEISETGSLPANLLFVAVPDEENTSAGMRGSVPWLVRLGEEWGLDYKACLNCEPSGKEGIPPSLLVYLGTIGTIMPFYLCVGKETHVGDYYEGLSASLINSWISILVEGTAATAECRGGVNYPPQACLSFRDLVRNYSVTLPERSAAYYNCLTLSRTPAQVLDEMKATAEEALQRTLEHLRREREAVCARGGTVPLAQNFQPRVMTFQELLKSARARTPDFEAVLGRFVETLPADMDERRRGIETASCLLDLSGEKGPLVVVGFLPPYYPSRLNLGRTGGEKAVLRAVDRLRKDVEELGVPFRVLEVLQGITDLSFCGFQGEPADLDALGANMPLWEKGYFFPLDDLKKIDIPVANLGPIGKDAHKNSERLHLSFFLETFPSLFRKFVDYLAQEAD